ncbi:MAG: hypothetical protein ACOX3R_04795 [Desulfitobacteriia bacterium]
MNHLTEQYLNPMFRLNKAYALNTDLSKAQNFSLSYNNRYLAFISGGHLQVIDLINNQAVLKNKSLSEAGLVLSYKWLPDRNGMIYLTQSHSNPDRPAALFSLDLDPATSNPRQVEPRLERSLNIFISEVMDIGVSTYTNNLFVLYRDEELKCKLMTIDIMKNINRLDDPLESILSLAVSNKYGTLYIESLKEGQKAIYAVIGRERHLVTDDPQEILLGCQDELLFIGELAGNTLREISLYTHNSSSIQYTKLLWQGDIPYARAEVFISSDQKVFILDKENIVIIYPDGSSKSKEILYRPVFSPVGKMYLEINPTRNEYFWRKS